MVLCLLVIVSPIGALFFGAADLSNGQLIHCITQGCQDPVNNMIFWEIRAPRVFVGFLVGAGLAVAGATLQNITRNGLADPYLFGVVSGAGLGASIATLLFDSKLAEQSGLLQILPNVSFSLVLPLAAFLFALFSVFLVMIFVA